MSWLSKLRSVFAGELPAPVTAEQEFQRAMAERAAGWEQVTRVEPVPNDFALNIYLGGDKPVRVFLGNLFKEIRELDPDTRDQHCQRFLRVMLDESTPLGAWSDCATRCCR